MYQVKFSNIGEIRMGSPYNGANVTISGDYIPDIKMNGFQDKCAYSENFDECYLVQWNSINNSPGFFVWKLSEKEKKFFVSKRFEGCCESIKFENGQIKVVVFQYPNEDQSFIVEF